MASKERIGEEDSIRDQLITVARQIIEDEGCSAVTARRLAEQVGLKRQIVHYYFGTIEDLFIAVIRRDGERIRRLMTEALESGDPTTLFWDMSSNPTATVLEFTAMAIRRKAVRAEVKRYVAEFRRIHADALATYLKNRGIKPKVAPVVVTILMASLGQTLAVESALGLTEGHAEAKAAVDEWRRQVLSLGVSKASASVSRKTTKTRKRKSA